MREKQKINNTPPLKLPDTQKLDYYGGFVVQIFFFK